MMSRTISRKPIHALRPLCKVHSAAMAVVQIAILFDSVHRTKKAASITLSSRDLIGYSSGCHAGPPLARETRRTCGNQYVDVGFLLLWRKYSVSI